MSLSRYQSSLVRKFVDTTESDRDIALTFLQACNWDLNNAISEYFSNPQYYNPRDHIQINSQFKVVKSIVEEIFKRFYDKTDDCGTNLGPKGVANLLNFLDIDFADRKVLILAWLCEASIQGEFSREELENGVQKMELKSINEIVSKLTNWDKNLDTPSYSYHFKSLYEYTYDFANDKPGRKWLPIPVAIDYWRILFRVEPPLLPRWFIFLENTDKGKITKDTWNLSLDFLLTMDERFKNYASDDCWPVLIDEFVEFTKSNI
uniref:Defective in cullin neddylation protein n=1 Tax=Parastrongyloides trichosuri TaxID=131310 RepID=A0A0N4Z7K9_PARTI